MPANASTKWVVWAAALVALAWSLLLGGRAAVVRADTVQGVVAGNPQVSLEDLHRGLSLWGQWRFNPGDDLSWAEPGFDDSGWDYMAVPRRWQRGGFPRSGQLAWYRLTLQLSPEAVAEFDLSQLALGIGEVLSAYELYAGGELLGGVGSLPPLSRVEYDRQRIFTIPETALDDQGRLVIALRVWGGETAAVRAWSGGPSSGTFKLGEYRTLILTGIIHQVPGLLFCAITLAFGAHYLLLYLRNRSLRTYLWFGLLALDMAVYGFLLTQWKYLFGLPFPLMQKIEFSTIYVFPALAVQMVWSLLRLPIARFLRLYQSSFVVLAALVVAVPGPAVHDYTLQLWQLWVLPLMVLVPWVLLQAARRGNHEARTLLPAIILFLGTCVNDLLIDLVYLDTPRLLPLGFIAVIMSMSVSIVNRFTTSFSKLESAVEQRTAELSEANRRLAEAARVDHLTGVLNRRGFTEEAEAEVARMLRTGVGFSIVLTDVDNFKRFNDQYGHVCGDHVLKRAAHILFKRIRNIDRIGRWGGEEFILMLPDTDTDGAAVLAEKLRETIADNVFEFEGQRMGITMTFGVAAFRRGDTLDTCIARADTALYHGKKDGRNRVLIGKYKGLSLVN